MSEQTIERPMTVRRVQRIKTHEDVTVTLTREDFVNALRTLVPNIPEGIDIGLAVLEPSWRDEGSVTIHPDESGLILTWSVDSEEIKEEES